MKTRRRVLPLLAAALLLACNFPTLLQAAPPSEVPVLATSTTAAAAPASTETPSSTPSPTLSPTPTVPQVTPNSVNVNCRSGPDVAYSATSVLMFGQTAQIDGRNDDSSWWYIYDPSNPGKFCWVAASVVTTSGNLAGLPVIAPPEAIVTNVTADVSIPSTVYCGGPNPLEFSGTITTNGATKVTYQWEVGGDRSNTTSPETLNFKAADTKDVSGPGTLSVDCGNYSITLHVLSPNDISGTRKFKVKP
jgi:hypothetical protein